MLQEKKHIFSFVVFFFFTFKPIFQKNIIFDVFRGNKQFGINDCSNVYCLEYGFIICNRLTYPEDCPVNVV